MSFSSIFSNIGKTLMAGGQAGMNPNAYFNPQQQPPAPVSNPVASVPAQNAKGGVTPEQLAAIQFLMAQIKGKIR